MFTSGLYKRIANYKGYTVLILILYLSQRGTKNGKVENYRQRKFGHIDSLSIFPRAIFLRVLY